jgi:hypothetical protein
LILEGDLDGAGQIADYMRDEDIAGHERAALLVKAATDKQNAEP